MDALDTLVLLILAAGIAGVLRGFWRELWTGISSGPIWQWPFRIFVAAAYCIIVVLLAFGMRALACRMLWGSTPCSTVSICKFLPCGASNATHVPRVAITGSVDYSAMV